MVWIILISDYDWWVLLGGHVVKAMVVFHWWPEGCLFEWWWWLGDFPTTWTFPWSLIFHHYDRVILYSNLLCNGYLSIKAKLICEMFEKRDDSLFITSYNMTTNIPAEKTRVGWELMYTTIILFDYLNSIVFLWATY